MEANGLENLIVGCNHSVEIGSIRHGTVVNEELQHVEVALKVVREATKTEYIEFCKSRQCGHLISNIKMTDRFYEIQIMD